MEFLKDGHMVRVSVVLRGREKAYKALVLEKLQRVEYLLESVSKGQ